MDILEKAAPRVIPVILSGGVGSRLWPVSRQQRPKPFMQLPDGDTLLSKTVKRACAVASQLDVLVVTNRDLYFATKDTVSQTLSEWDFEGSAQQHYVLEPCGRNTAPAISAAALMIEELYGEDALMLVMAADHLIEDESAFLKAVNIATSLANEGELVTFGIKPTRPDTGYGYIQAAIDIGTSAGKVDKFVEKPDADRAQTYYQSSQFFWNAGIFCFSVKAFLEESRLHAESMLRGVSTAYSASQVATYKDGTQLELNQTFFSKVEDISIDYALFELSSRVSVVPCDIGWSDIGSWGAWADLVARDESNNAIHGEVVTFDTENTFIHSPHALIATIGLSDMIIVNTEDALLVAHKDKEQDVKKVVKELGARCHGAKDLHRTVQRPWGSFTTLEIGERFKIKRLVVRPECSLSLQLHHHRSEHWIVVQGMAEVTNGNETCLLNTNESTFISAGHKHRLRNPGIVDLIVIEVQSGDYLGEDDIVRFDDQYGRAT